MTARFTMTALAVGFLLVVPAVTPAVAEGGSVAKSCPAYRTHLRTARAYLARGDRVATLSELQRAQRALESCLREDAGEIALASRRLCTPIG